MKVSAPQELSLSIFSWLLEDSGWLMMVKIVANRLMMVTICWNSGKYPTFLSFPMVYIDSCWWLLTVNDGRMLTTSTFGLCCAGRERTDTEVHTTLRPGGIGNSTSTASLKWFEMIFEREINRTCMTWMLSQPMFLSRALHGITTQVPRYATFKVFVSYQQLRVPTSTEMVAPQPGHDLRAQRAFQCWIPQRVFRCTAMWPWNSGNDARFLCLEDVQLHRSKCG